MIVRLLVWIYVNGPAVLKLIQHNTLLTQMNIQTMKRLILISMLKFAGIMGGLDFGVQVAQQIWGDREAGDFDVASLAMSVGSGALTGALFAGANVGLSRLLSREMVYVASEVELAVRDKIVAIGQSMYGQALLGGVAGTAGAVPGLALSGQLDASHLAYTFISGVAGGLDIPASARVSHIPMQAVAQIGDTTLTNAPHVDTDPPRAPGGQSPPAPRVVEYPPHTSPGGNTPPATGRDTTTLVHHPRPEHHADVDTLINRQPSEPGANLPQPHSSGVIVGEVTRRHDMPLYSAAGDRAEQGGTLTRPPQSLPAERTPIGETTHATPRAEAAIPGSLPRSSLLPATVPAIISAAPDDAGSAEPDAAQGSHHGQGSAAPKTAETAAPASTGQGRPERPQQSLTVDSALPASHPLREHSAPPVTDPQISTLSTMPQDRTGPALESAAGPAAARLVTSHGDRPGDPDRARSGERGELEPILANPNAGSRQPRALGPTPPPAGQIEQLPGHAPPQANGMARETALPASRVPQESIGTAVPETARDRTRPAGTPAGPHQMPPNTTIPDEFSPIADPRPRNFAEAEAIVHRWTPDNGNTADTNRRQHSRPHQDSTANRIERLLSGPPEGRSPDSTDSSPPAVPDEELLAEGRRLTEQLPVIDQSETTARALASMSRTIGGPNPRRAIHELAAELGLSLEIDALIEVFNDARRYGMSPDSATDRAALTDILRRCMAADSYRWTGYRHQTVFSLLDTTATQARTVGLMIGMMGDPVTQSRARNFIGPVLERYGIRDVTQLLPVVQAAHQNGYFPRGTTGDTAFRAAMDRFWQEDPYLWNGVLLAERYSLTDPGDATVRLVALLDEIVTRSGVDTERTVLPLERLADDAGQGRSIEHLIRLAEDAQAHGADLARPAGPQELTGILAAHRARDPHLWDGLRIAAENDVTHPSDDEARALSRLAEITSSERSSRLWVFDPLRRLAGDAGLDHSVERLAQRTAEAQQNGFDLFGPVDRRQVLDVLTQHVGRSANGRLPDTRNIPSGLHDLSPSIVRDARQVAIHEHAKAQEAYRQARPTLRRALSLFAGPDPLAVAKQERVASLEARVQAWRRWPDLPEASFTRDFAAFRSAYDQAVERAARGEAVLPYMLDNATASLAARDGGRGFGLELEFDLPDHTARQGREAIARALYEAGLTSDAQVHGYHTMQGQGYRSGTNGGRGLWKLEQDGTVAGELVSPILYDEPATWENLRIACEIIRSHGGTASPSTGGHVHVSTHDYDHIVENYTSVLNYMGHHTDTLFRLGHNPERESHRGLKHCHPNQLPAAGYESVAPVRSFNSSHDFAMNMQGMKGSSKDHIEFRLWDGSLHPAVIQSQVKVSLALIEAAFRNATLGDLPNGGRRDPLGAHAELLKLHPAPDLTERGSLSFRRLMDEIFWRAADKEQLTALYAATRWVRPA
ncbi:hypothetical protein EJK15_05345 [Nonomuraea basaltis]|nr:hypothetical protein EJK15_05345 [Nonomuraea basaltis]